MYTHCFPTFTTHIKYNKNFSKDYIIVSTRLSFKPTGRQSIIYAPCPLYFSSDKSTYFLSMSSFPSVIVHHPHYSLNKPLTNFEVPSFVCFCFTFIFIPTYTLVIGKNQEKLKPSISPLKGFIQCYHFSYHTHKNISNKIIQIILSLCT